MKKIKIISLMFFISFCISSCKSTSQVQDKIKTKILWAESYLGHYTNSEDTMLKGIGGFVSYIAPFDTITRANYVDSYYEIDKKSYRNAVLYDTMSNDDYVKNDSIFSKFSFDYEGNTKIMKIKFNNIWQYNLSKVTYKEHYIGLIEQYVPKFESSKNSPYLGYEKIKIPTYLIKLISIEPFYKE